MSKQNGSKAEVYAILTVEAPKCVDSWEYGHLILSFVHYNDEGKIRNFSLHESPELSDLRVYSQFASKEPDHIYAWECNYDTGLNITLLMAETMYKQLAKIHKGLEKLQAEWGYPQSSSGAPRTVSCRWRFVGDRQLPVR